MKKIIILVALFAGLYSCEKENEIEIPTSTQTDSLGTLSAIQLKSISPSNKAVSYKGKRLYSGIGYDPTRNDMFKPPAFIMDDINFKIDNGRSIQFFSEINILKENREFEAKVKPFSVRSFQGLRVELGVMPEVVNGKLKLTESTTTVMAVVSFKTKRYEMDQVPRLTEEAVALLNSGKDKEFLKTYGPMFIERQNLGGDIYFFYTYRTANYNKENRTALETKVRYDLASFLNAPGPKRKLSDEERKTIEANLLERSFYTNLKGYKPLKRTITSVESFEKEKQNLVRYINQRESRAATTELQLRSYASVLRDDPRLRISPQTRGALNNAYSSKYACYQNLEKWRAVRANLVYVRNNTADPVLKNDTKAALANVVQQINNANNCRNSVPPPPTAGEALRTRYEQEKGATN